MKRTGQEALNTEMFYSLRAERLVLVGAGIAWNPADTHIPQKEADLLQSHANIVVESITHLTILPKSLTEEKTP